MAAKADPTSKLQLTAVSSLENIYAVRRELWPRIRTLVRRSKGTAATTDALADLGDPWLAGDANLPVKMRKGNIAVYVAHELDVLAAVDMPPRPDALATMARCAGFATRRLHSTGGGRR